MDPLTLADGETREVEVRFREGIALRGTVTTDAGGPASGVKVSADGSEPAITAPDGSFTLFTDGDREIMVMNANGSNRVKLTDGREIEVDSPADMPDPSKIDDILEPWMTVSVVSPDRFIGAIMELVIGRRSVPAVYLLLGIAFGSVPAFLTFLAYLRGLRHRMGRARLM